MKFWSPSFVCSRVKVKTGYLIFITLLGFTCTCGAVNVYQEPQDFINEVFNGADVKKGRLWINGKLKPAIHEILDHDLGVLRLSYWEHDSRTAWILDEIGKEQPITIGIVVNESGIEQVKVLVFRESRGWEIRYPFFTDQFIGARLENDLELSNGIDGITGATLSVIAVEKLVRLALLLHQNRNGMK